MHETTVRFSDELWAHVQEASRDGGISAAQFVREATVARIAAEASVALLRRDVTVAVRRLDERLRRLEEVLRHRGLG
jgi:predicted DNA-binding protein